MSRAILKYSAVLFLGILFFSWNLQQPDTVNFDEFHYVPAAKTFSQRLPVVNLEHPPLGKELIAVGLSIFGDQPIGWRAASVLFGALSLLGVFLLALEVFQSEKKALFCLWITAMNGLLYVQARIATLDIFLFCFFLYGILFYWRAFSRLRAGNLTVAGVFWGLAIATKWFAIIPWFFLLMVLLGVSLHFHTSLSLPKKLERALHIVSHQFTRKRIVLTFCLLPLFVYYLTFLPYFFMPGGATDLHSILYDLQFQIWDGQRRVTGSHGYHSPFWEWPLLLRPIWYAYAQDPPDYIRGVVQLGNPFVLWTGFLAALYCLKRFLFQREYLALGVFALWFVPYASWIVIPRKVSFFYYYFPAGTLLSFAIVYALNKLPAEKKRFISGAYLFLALATFVFFFPIYSAMKVPSHWLPYWMWFRFWI